MQLLLLRSIFPIFASIVYATHTNARALSLSLYRNAQNIVRLYGGVWNEGADKLCIVLEFCTNGSLESFLSDSAGTWAGQRHGFAVGAAKGLAYLHHEFAEPLLHRDIKPDNVLVGDGLVAKLADFGESTRFDKESARRSSTGNTATMTMVGTKCYCAPEVMMQKRCKCAMRSPRAHVLDIAHA